MVLATGVPVPQPTSRTLDAGGNMVRAPLMKLWRPLSWLKN